MSTFADFFDYSDGKKKALKPRTREEQFSSPAVIRAMKEADRLGEELRRWRESRKGKKVTYPNKERLTFIR